MARSVFGNGLSAELFLVESKCDGAVLALADVETAEGHGFVEVFNLVQGRAPVTLIVSLFRMKLDGWRPVRPGMVIAPSRV